MKPNKVVLIIGSIIGVVAIAFVVALWSNLKLFPFDMIPLTTTDFMNKSAYYKDRFGNYYFGMQAFMMEYKKVVVDENSFKVLSSSYAKDSNNAFYRGVKIEAVDSASFTVIPSEYQYIESSDRVYVESRRATFTNDSEKSGEFAADKNMVFFNGYAVVKNTYNSIKNIATNIVVADNDILVGNVNYSGGTGILMKAPKIDLRSFRPYTEEFWGDNVHVYCRQDNQVVPLLNLNPETFRYYGKKSDGNGSYVVGDGTTYYTYFGGCKETTL